MTQPLSCQTSPSLTREGECVGKVWWRGDECILDILTINNFTQSKFIKIPQCVNYVTYKRNYIVVPILLRLPFKIYIPLKMNSFIKKNIGLYIVLIGFSLTVLMTSHYFKKEKIANIGVIEIIDDEPLQIKWSPMIGLAIMGLGVFMVWRSYKYR